MKAYGYIVSVIQMLQRKHNLYSIVTPGEFDILYRWWEKRVPLSLIDDCTAAARSKRERQGKKAPEIKDLAHPVRRSFTRYRENTIGCLGRTENSAPPENTAEKFLNNPPTEIADLVGGILAPVSGFPLPEEVVTAFQKALLERYSDDEELERRTRSFSSHLAPSLQSESLLERYRINLLISRFGIPDLEGEEAGEP